MFLKKTSSLLQPQHLKRTMKIYTKTGDKGTSSLYNGKRFPKTEIYFQALGDTDELNASLGLAREYCIQDQNGLDEKLTKIQSRLLDVGSSIATPLGISEDDQLERVHFDEEYVLELEQWIDEVDETLPPLSNFILPSGGLASSSLHVSRTIARRAERNVMGLILEEQCPPQVGMYLNRLSDYLFVVARFAAKHAQRPETVYKKGQ